MPTRQFFASRVMTTTVVSLGLIVFQGPDALAEPAAETSLEHEHKASLYLASNGTLDPVEFDREHPYAQLDQHPDGVEGILFGVDRTGTREGDRISIAQEGRVLAKARIQWDHNEPITGSYLPFFVPLTNLCEDITITVKRKEEVLSGATLRLICME